jgi:two-component system, sensor histidine kinase PhcS
VKLTPSVEDLPTSYEEAKDQHMKFYSRVTCVVAMVLVLSGVGLDLAFYPSHIFDFGIARVVVVALIGATLLSYQTEFGARNIRRLTYFWIALPQLMIAWMVFQTDGEASIYFVGLTLAISGLGVFLPLSVWEALGFSLFTMVAYSIACLLRPKGVQQMEAFWGQLIFFAFYGVMAITISVYSGRWRHRTFLLQAEVNNQHQKLL